LVALEHKCPTGDLHIPFKWKDAFDKGGGFLSSSTSLSIANLSYEKCCILFNIAAIRSNIASMLANEGVNNDISLKSSAKYFQSASGIFQALKHLTPSVGQTLTADLSEETLHAFHNLMLAQAQELFFFKASNDNMKDMIIARIANQCEEYFGETLKQMPILNLSGVEKDWTSCVAMKQLAFQGIAEYYQAQVCLQNKDFGEEICRAEKAIECLKAAESRGGAYFVQHFKTLLNKAVRLCDEAKEDNNFIYHARIPDYKSLDSISKASLVKPTPMPEKFRPNYSNPFEKLLPVKIQLAGQKLELYRQKLVNDEIATLRELMQTLNAVLASLNLPASLEDISGVELPPSIKEKAEKLRGMGGIKVIEKLISDLPELLKRNKEILEVSKGSLKSEAESDKSLREQFKDKWTPTPSSHLNSSFSQLIDKYQKIIENAVAADEKIKKTYSENKQMISLLSAENESEIAKAIPKGSETVSSALNSAPALELKKLMVEVDEIKNENLELESSFKNAVYDDMKSKFYTALIQDGSLNEDALALESIGSVYSTLQKQVRDLKVKQDALIVKIRKANDEFVKEKKNDTSSNERSNFLSNLASAFDAFTGLQSNLKEGNKFYNDLTTLLVNLQGKLDDFCFARKAEREERCREIQTQIASTPQPSTPTPPSYHTSSTGDSSAPTSTDTTSNSGQPSAAGSNFPYSMPYPANQPYQQYFYPPPPLPSGYNPFANPYPMGKYS